MAIAGRSSRSIRRNGPSCRVAVNQVAAGSRAHRASDPGHELVERRPELAPEDVAFDQDFVLRAFDDDDSADSQSCGEALSGGGIGHPIGSGCDDEGRSPDPPGKIRFVETLHEAKGGMRPADGWAAE